MDTLVEMFRVCDIIAVKTVLRADNEKIIIALLAFCDTEA